MEQYLNLPTITTVLGLIALLGGAAGYYKASRGETIIKLQEKESAIKDQTIARLEKEKIALQAEKDAAVQANTKMQEHVNFLQNIAQGSPELKLLKKAIENNTNVIKAFFRQEKVR